MDAIRKNRIELLLLFMLLVFILPRQYMEYDMGFWKEWALYIHEHGVANAYGSGTNYLPVYIYLLYGYDLLQGSAAAIAENIYLIKLAPLFFDFLPLFVLCCFRQRLFPFPIPHFYLLLNIAYLFNSLIWGQIDSIFTNLSFLAILVALRYPVGGLLLYLLALNTKVQAIVFLPVMVIVLIYSVKNLRTVFIGLGSMAALQLLLVLPFLLNGSISKVLAIPMQAVDLFPKLSISAFNFWYIVESGNPYFIDDKSTWFLLSYKQAGLLLFMVSSGLVLLPLLVRLWRKRKEGTAMDRQSFAQLFLACGLISLYFFYFNSQMHERYAHPIIIFLFFYAVLSKNYIPYILASISYFLSLDKAFPDYLPIVHYKIIFASRVIAIWYTITVIYTSYVFASPQPPPKEGEVL